MLAFALGAFIGCKKGGENNTEIQYKIVVDGEDTQIDIGETYQMVSAYVTDLEGNPVDRAITYQVRNPNDTLILTSFGSFRCTSEGDYTVTYTAVDFIGNESRPLTFTVKVTAGGTQFKTEEVFLPEVLLDGVQYTFPEIRAVTYGASGIEREGTAEISVLTPAGEQVLDGRVYMPSAAENLEPVTFRLKFDGKTQEIAIPVAKPMNGDYLLFDRMFYADSADVSVVMDTDLEIRAAAASNSRIWYANRILADFLSISFESLSADMDAFHLWIVDSVNPEEQLCFRIVRSGSGAMVSINGGTPVAFQGSFDPSAQSGFSISYLSESKVFQDASKTGSISVPDESWKGFSSGYVYFCFEFTEEGVPAGSGVRINSVNQQNFIGNEDFNRPMISIEDIIGGIYDAYLGKRRIGRRACHYVRADAFRRICGRERRQAFGKRIARSYGIRDNAVGTLCHNILFRGQRRQYGILSRGVLFHGQGGSRDLSERSSRFGESRLVGTAAGGDGIRRKYAG